MNSRALRALTALAVIGVLFAACSADKNNTQTTPSRLSKRGESCQSSVDCDTSLVCVRGTCSVGDYMLAPTGKQCVLVSCHTAQDCCPKPQGNICAQYLSACEAGITAECTIYQSACVCDGSKYSCDNGKCTQACMPASPDGFTLDTCRTTLGGGYSCVGGKCVECTKDTDCQPVGSVARTCKDNKCQIKCTKDADCDPFYKCDMASSACVYSGCKTKLECIAKSGNPLATCNAGQCDVPCQSDPECTSTTTVVQPVGGVAAVPGLQVCDKMAGRCVDVGCDTDDQCRIMNHIVGGSATTAECQPVTMP